MIDKPVAISVAAPRNAFLGNHGKVAKWNNAPGAYPCRRRGQFFEMFNGLDSHFLHFGPFISQCIVELELALSNTQYFSKGIVKFSFFFVDFRMDSKAKLLLGRRNFPFAWIKGSAVLREKPLDLAGRFQCAQIKHSLELGKARIVVKDGKITETRRK